MAQLRLPQDSRTPASVHHLRAPEPIVFPEEEEVSEGYTHLVLRTFLFRLLRFALGPGHSVGSDQFIYWLATDPARKLSPDVFVRLGVAQTSFGSWKTWEQGGAPDLAVEVISPNEGDGVDWKIKLRRYHEVGVTELVRFDPEAPLGTRLRAWDRVRHDLVERQIANDFTPCLTLGLNWVVRPVEGEPVGLRLIDDDGQLLLAQEESEAKAREAETKAREAETKAREAETKAREAETKAREAAEARVRELEAMLARMSS